MAITAGSPVAVSVDKHASDVEYMPATSTELQTAEWLDGADGPAVGARFRGHNRHDAVGEWSTTSHVVECEPERVFAWAVEDPANPAATWRFRLEPTGGGTRLTQSAQLVPGPSKLSLMIERSPHREQQLVHGRLQEFERNMTATLEHIKTRAEA